MSSDTVEERARAMIDELRKIRQRYQLITEEIARLGVEVKERDPMDVEERTEKIKKDYLIISEALNHLEFEALSLDRKYAKEQSEISKLFL